MALGIPSHKVSQTIHLKDAVENNNIEMAEKYLKSPNISYITLNNALRTASLNGNFEMVKLLVEHGASIVTSKNMPIICAAANGHIDIVKYFLENGADCTDRSNRAISEAIKNGHTEIVKLLIKNGADWTSNDQYDISSAIENGHLDTVKFLVESDSSFIITQHEHAINDAARKGDLETVKFFLDKISHSSLLFIFSSACASGNLELVKYILEKANECLDKSIYNIYEFNPLRRAASYGHIDIIKFLFEQNCDFSNDIDEAFACAAEGGYLEAMELLMEKGANCNAVMYHLRGRPTAIFFATENNHLEAVEFLINHGAANTSKQKIKLIEIAAAKGYMDIVEFLLNRVKKVNLNMAIKYATQNGHIEISKLLIKHTLIHTSKDFDAQVEMITKLTNDILNKR